MTESNLWKLGASVIAIYDSGVSLKIYLFSHELVAIDLSPEDNTILRTCFFLLLILSATSVSLCVSSIQNSSKEDTIQLLSNHLIPSSTAGQSSHTIPYHKQLDSLILNSGPQFDVHQSPPNFRLSSLNNRVGSLCYIMNSWSSELWSVYYVHRTQRRETYEGGTICDHFFQRGHCLLPSWTYLRK